MSRRSLRITSTVSMQLRTVKYYIIQYRTIWSHFWISQIHDSEETYSVRVFFSISRTRSRPLLGLDVALAVCLLMVYYQPAKTKTRQKVKVKPSRQKHFPLVKAILAQNTEVLCCRIQKKYWKRLQSNKGNKVKTNWANSRTKTPSSVSWTGG